MNVDRYGLGANVLTPAGYRDVFEKLRPDQGIQPELWGRLLRGKEESDFEWLSQPYRKLAWVIGFQGLLSMVGKTGYQILLDLGIKKERVVDNWNKGMRWKLVVFSGSRCRPADWDGLFAMVREHYGNEVASRLDRHAEQLRCRGNPLSEDQKKYFGAPAIREHRQHKDHMSPERYLAREGGGTAEDAWVFLWHSLGMNDKYRGNGYALRDDGQPGDKEYLTANARIASLPEVEVIDLTVVPDSADVRKAGRPAKRLAGHEEEMEPVWDGITKPETLKPEAAAIRHQLADAAKAYNWPLVVDLLGRHPELVNTIRPGGHSLSAPLHQAAHGGAPVEVVEQMLSLGAWRTLQNAKGERPVDVAERRGHRHLLPVLEPVIKRRVPLGILLKIQHHFHAVIQERVRTLDEGPTLRLPELEPLLEMERPKLWFPVPGMYGGFSFWLEEPGVEGKLITESWCRIVGGSGQRHEITSTGSRLTDEGFV